MRRDKNPDGMGWDSGKIPYCPSPIRYPGGKGKALKEILRHIPANIGEVMSPFLGGASVEIALAQLGVRVYGYDLFDPLICFWKTALRRPDALSDKASRFLPPTKTKVMKLRKTMFKTNLDKACAFFVLNRTTYGGSTYSGGYTGDRLTKSSLDKLRSFRCHRLRVDKGDFRNTIPNHPDAFLYLDPPYYNQPNPLYGKNGDAHKDFPHDVLAKILRRRSSGWLLSYDDCPEIRDLYKGCRFIRPQEWQYSLNAKQGRNFRDILIVPA